MSAELRELLTKHAQQATRDVLHCAQDVKDDLSAWVDEANGSEPVVPIPSWMTVPLHAMLAVDIVVHDDWAAGRWELVSDGLVVASSNDVQRV